MRRLYELPREQLLLFLTYYKIFQTIAGLVVDESAFILSRDVSIDVSVTLLGSFKGKGQRRP